MADEAADPDYEQFQLETSEGEHVTYKLVPWLNWEEWNYVRKSLFSASPEPVAAALRRISAWRARGPLPVAVDVTAAIFEIQQKDPYFREGLPEGVTSSDEMLAMSYCMVIIRLVNGFVEKSYKAMKKLPFKKKGARASISLIAEEMGIPRMLVDIRHEGSHRSLPSLSLVRTASLKALDWLKSNYWEPQRKAIPNVRKEAKSRLREIVFSLHAKKSWQSKFSGRKGKRAKSGKHSKLLSGRFSHLVGLHQCSKSRGLSAKNIGFKRLDTILRSLIRLYSSSPLEVVTVFLEEFLSKVPSSDAFELVDYAGYPNFSTSGDSKSHLGTIDDWKAIVSKLLSKEPAFLLTMIEEILEMIQAREAMQFEMGESQILQSNYQAEICQIGPLSSLLLWLFNNLKEAKDSGHSLFRQDATVTTTAEATLTALASKCLMLLTPGNKHLQESVQLLVEMLGKNSLTQKLKKLVARVPDQDLPPENMAMTDLELALSHEEDCINQEAKRLESLKLSRAHCKTMNTESGHGNTERRPWTVAQSWNKCPIGMLPCVFGSSGILPVLDRTGNIQLQKASSIESDEHSESTWPDAEQHGSTRPNGKREASCEIELLEESSAVKKIREMAHDHGLVENQDSLEASPIQGKLMIGGVWKKVGEEELLAIEAGIRILV